MLRGIVAVGYIGWAAYSATSLFVSSGPGAISVQSSYGDKLVVSGLVGSILVAFWTLFAIQRSPWTFYLYIAFPCYFWHEVLRKVWKPFSRFWPRRERKVPKWSIPVWHRKDVLSRSIAVCLGFVGLQSMVVSNPQVSECPTDKSWPMFMRLLTHSALYGV